MAGAMKESASMLENISTKKLYRDCLRLARVVAVNSGNDNNTLLRERVRTQFRANLHLQDPKEIEAKRQMAVSAMTNYYLYIAKKDLDRMKAERASDDDDE